MAKKGKKPFVEDKRVNDTVMSKDSAKKSIKKAENKKVSLKDKKTSTPVKAKKMPKKKEDTCKRINL